MFFCIKVIAFWLLNCLYFFSFFYFGYVCYLPESWFVSVLIIANSVYRIAIRLDIKIIIWYFIWSISPEHGLSKKRWTSIICRDRVYLRINWFYFAIRNWFVNKEKKGNKSKIKNKIKKLFHLVRLST